MVTNHSTTYASLIDANRLFNPITADAQTFIEEFLAEQANIKQDAAFIEEVFLGMTKYAKVLKVPISVYLESPGPGSLILKSEVPDFLVLTYLLLFKVEDIGLNCFKAFVQTRNLQKMKDYMKFVCDDEKLRHWASNEWACIYEPKFVDTFILKPISSYMSDILDFCDVLSKKIEATAFSGIQGDDNLSDDEATNDRSNYTVPKPFNLTKPKPVCIPLPEEIPKLPKPKSVPSTVYREPSIQEELNKKREENRAKARALLEDLDKTAFSCAKVKSQSQEDIAESRHEHCALLETEASFKPMRFSNTRTPAAVKQSKVDIKLNAAAILREKAHYKKREDETMRVLEALAAGQLVDDNDYDQKLQQRQLEEAEERSALVEARKIQAKLAYEQALFAKQIKVKENHDIASELRTENKHLQMKHQEMVEIEQEEMKRMAVTILETREKAKQAKKEVKKVKQQIAKQVVEESKLLAQQAEKIRQEEMKRRAELIAEIRAIEAVPVDRERIIDFTESPGYGLMNEMSLAELRERLIIVKAEREKELSERRRAIIQSKSDKERSLDDAMTVIARHREEKTKGAILKREQKKVQQRAELDAKVTDDRVQQLNHKLQAMRDKRKRLAQHLTLTTTGCNGSAANDGANPGAKQFNNLASLRKKAEQERFRVVEAAQSTNAQRIAHGDRGDYDITRLAIANK